jgi:hypothetical protein
LVKWYTKNKNKNFEMVLVSADNTEPAMLKYLKGKKVNFPSMSFKNRESKLVAQHGDNLIPSFALVGEDGKAIIKSSDDGTFDKIAKKVLAK